MNLTAYGPSIFSGTPSHGPGFYLGHTGQPTPIGAPFHVSGLCKTITGERYITTRPIYNLAFYSESGACTEWLGGGNPELPAGAVFEALGPQMRFDIFGPDLPQMRVFPVLNARVSPWVGKGYAQIGDSNTAMPGIAEAISEALGTSLVFCKGVFSASIFDMREHFTAANLSRAHLCNIALGTNTPSKSRPLGTLGDTGSSGTVYGDIHELIRLATVANPNMRLTWTTPPKYFSPPHWATVYSAGFNLEAVAGAIIKVCGQQSVPVVHDFHENGINEFNHTEWYEPDGVHFKPAKRVDVAHWRVRSKLIHV